ncbi:hypothetical protein ACFYXM_28105 [Streptomyces sp. NPDC002476]|uniref:hypothetical protein n=1 Tax=Streptomyces sp. NPDC002476 TaxID=3364648 RepID=UPI00369113D3
MSLADALFKVAKVVSTTVKTISVVVIPTLDDGRQCDLVGALVNGAISCLFARDRWNCLCEGSSNATRMPPGGRRCPRWGRASLAIVAGWRRM